MRVKFSENKVQLCLQHCLIIKLLSSSNGFHLLPLLPQDQNIPRRWLKYLKQRKYKHQHFGATVVRLGCHKNTQAYFFPLISVSCFHTRSRQIAVPPPVFTVTVQAGQRKERGSKNRIMVLGHQPRYFTCSTLVVSDSGKSRFYFLQLPKQRQLNRALKIEISQQIMTTVQSRHV